MPTLLCPPELSNPRDSATRDSATRDDAARHARNMAPLPADWKTLVERHRRFVDSDQFHCAEEVDAEHVLSRASRAAEALRSAAHGHIAADVEAEGFLLFNWCRQRLPGVAEDARSGRLARPRAAALLKQLDQSASRLRNLLAECYLRMAVAAARTAGLRGENEHLLSDIAETLLASVERFNVDLGFRFSTYLTLAVRRKVARLTRQRQRRRQFDGVSLDDERPPIAPAESSEAAALQQLAAVQRIRRWFSRLESRQREILAARFNLSSSQPRRPSLRQLGQQLGISRERVRQLEQLALRQLRRWADEEGLKLDA